MLEWLMKRQLAAFEREYDYDMSYARDILKASPRALMLFARVMGLSQYRDGLPLDAWYAAKLAATMGEDCGPCTQLVVRMAEREGVPAAALRAMLARRPEDMPADCALAWRYSLAALAHDMLAEELRPQVMQRWGQKGLVTLALALTSSRMYPTLKYALGHGHQCVRVRVAGADLAVAQAA